MSLIHEALKRAEADKLKQSPYFNNFTVLPPAEDEVPPPPRPDAERAARGGAFSVLCALAGLLLAAGAVGGWYLWSRHGGPAGASAAGVPTAEPAPTRTPAAPTPGAPSHAAGAIPSRSPGPAPARTPTTCQAELALTRTMDLVRYYRPDSDATPAEMSRAAAAAAATGTGTGQAGNTQATSEGPMGPTTAPGPAVPAAEPGQATQPASRTTTAPAAAEAPRNSVRVEGRKFLVNAIMRGPTGNAALINGYLFQEGQTVDGAKVLKIGSHFVELELGGQRFTIRL